MAFKQTHVPSPQEPCCKPVLASDRHIQDFPSVFRVLPVKSLWRLAKPMTVLELRERAAVFRVERL